MKLVTAEAYIDWFTETMANRVEPKFQIESWEKETIEKLYQAGMIGFLQKFNGHSEEITKDFIKNFNQDQTRIGEIIVPVTQEYLSKALDLPMLGEKYYKGLHFKEKAWTFFLEKNRKGTFDRTKGIPREWFNEPWGELVLIIQKFLTCDRGYSVAHLYHVKLLQHIKGEDRINLPYFLYKSLLRMIETARHENRLKSGQMYHQGLIKILVEYQVRLQGIVWREFMVKNHFTEQITEVQEKTEQESRGVMNSPMYPRTRAKQQNNMAMDYEISVMSIPKRFTNKSPINLDREEETYFPRPQEENNIPQEEFDRDSAYDDEAAASLMKTTQDFEKDGKIKDLTDQLEISKIVEKQLEEENKENKKENAKLIKTNEKLKEDLGRLKRKNDLISKQAFKWLKEKNMWQAKYEKQKVKATLFKERHDTGLDCLARAAQQEASTGTTSTSERRRSKRNRQAWGHA